MEEKRITEREFIPMPCEYLEEMQDLTDEDFGRLMRALLAYGMYGTEVTLGGDCRFFCRRVMNKDDYYSARAKEELERARKRSEAARKSAGVRYAQREEPGVSSAEEGNATESSKTRKNCERMQTHTDADKDKSSQVRSSQDRTGQYRSVQEKGIPQDHTVSCNTVSAEQTAAPAGEVTRCGGKAFCTPPQSGFVLTLPLVDKTEFGITEEDVSGWKAAYPAVDVMQEIHEMRAWLEANPTHKKTRTGIRRFIVSWLSREQDKARPGAGSAGAVATGSHKLLPTVF